MYYVLREKTYAVGDTKKTVQKPLFCGYDEEMLQLAASAMNANRRDVENVTYLVGVLPKVEPMNMLNLAEFLEEHEIDLE